MSVNDLRVNSAIRFLCDKYHAGRIRFRVSRGLRLHPRFQQIRLRLIILFLRIVTDRLCLCLVLMARVNACLNLRMDHLPQDLVLVLDRSGSTNHCRLKLKMLREINLKMVCLFLILLNTVPRTLIQSVDPNSRVAIVVFDDRIEIVFELMPMTEMNRTRATCFSY